MKYFFLLITFAPLLVIDSRNGIAQPSDAPLIETSTTKAKNIKVFEALWEKVNSKYFDPNFNGVSWSAVKDKYRSRAESAENKRELLKVLNQMLSELKTSHLFVWQTVSEKRLEKKLQENFDRKRDSLAIGYGFGARPVEGKVVVNMVEPNSKAEAAGVKIGWTLDELNGVSTKGNVGIAADFAEGATTRFTFRDVGDQRHDTVLTAELRASKPIRQSRIVAEDKNVLYIKFTGFRVGTADWLKAELAKIDRKARVILDLRGNSGGYVDEVKDSLSWFFSDDLEFGTFIERSGKIKVQRVKGRGERAFLGGLVVLVDLYTASGAEIFAQLIRENGRGTVVGEVTSGQVLESLSYGLPEDFRASIAFRDYASPRGYRIETKGVVPDLPVVITVDDIRTSRDAAMEKAVEILTKTGNN